MVSLKAGPMYVALIQTAAALPFFVFALPAGAIGDIVDRRKLILFTETWMVMVAAVLAGLTIAGRISPTSLLLLTFALSAGEAFETPTWRAVLPELVQKEDLNAAAILNGVEFNFARAVGPALAGIVIALASVGTAFLLNTASFAAVIVVIARWKRRARRHAVPRETLPGATIAALRYVRYSPTIRAAIFRSGIVMLAASALLALLPLLAHNVESGPIGYGLLLGSFGLGSLLGALLMQPLKRRCSNETIVSSGIVLFGMSTIASGVLRGLAALCAALLVGGAAWILFISLFSVLILNLTPDWVRARVLAVSMLVLQGATAAGSAAWGALASRSGVSHTLIYAGVGVTATLVLGVFLRLPDATVDVTPWIHWPAPRIIVPPSIPVSDIGPVLVTVEYDVVPEKSDEFLKAARRFGRIRRRDGATQWGIFRDLEVPSRYLETFLVYSWAEHLRQHERLTVVDRRLEERIRQLISGSPKVHHLAAAKPIFTPKHTA